MAENIFLITPSGNQSFDEATLNQTLDAVDNGGTLTPDQQKVVNIFGMKPANPVQPTVNPAGPLGQKNVADEVSGFLKNLSPSNTPQPTTLGATGPSTGPTLAGTNLDLSKLLFPGLNLASISSNNVNNASGLPLGDADLSEEVENLRLRAEKHDLMKKLEQQKFGPAPAAPLAKGGYSLLRQRSGPGFGSAADNATSIRRSVIGTSRQPTAISTASNLEPFRHRANYLRQDPRTY